MRYQPAYSHGGSSVSGWTAVSSTTTGGGRPICVYPAIQKPAMSIFTTGTAGTVTFMIQASQGQPDASTGAILEASWVNALSANLTISVGDTLGKKVYITFPFWRTYLVGTTGDAGLVSSIGPIIIGGQNGPMAVSPSYPDYGTITTDGVV